MTSSSAAGVGFLNDSTAIKINTLKVDDVFVALEKGFRDFFAAPKFGLVLGSLFVLGGWSIVYALGNFDLYYLIYPMASGFALIAPFVAAGLYEVSRLRESDSPVTWKAVRGAIGRTATGELGVMAIVAFFSLIIWVAVAFVLYLLIFGWAPKGPLELISTILTTGKGLLFFMLGNMLGLLLAASVFMVTVISYPMLFSSSRVDFITGIITSIRATVANPLPMTVWAVTIGASLLISLATGLLLLVVTLPILGHTTYHLYKRTIELPD